MKNNDEILNELFFKKKKQSYTDAFKNQQAQYSPVTNISDTKNLFTDFDGKLNVSDMDEVKKRLVGALGMALGSNTVKSMAGKAIKNFPIIVSDDISSETLVMIKNMMEEQYASYIDLLILLLHFFPLLLLLIILHMKSGKFYILLLFCHIVCFCLLLELQEQILF